MSSEGNKHRGPTSRAFHTCPHARMSCGTIEVTYADHLQLSCPELYPDAWMSSYSLRKSGEKRAEALMAWTPIEKGNGSHS